MRRTIRIVLVLAIAVAGLTVAGCQKKVSVKTGTRVECSYGHVISDNIATREVPANEASKYRAKTVVTVCPRHKQAEALYAQAQAALAKGDATTAQSKLKEVLGLDSAFGEAQKQIDSIAKGVTPKPDKSNGKPGAVSGGDSKTPGDGDTATPAGQLTSWTPDTISGYKAAKPAIDVLTVTREYVPENSARLLMVIAVEQQRSAEGAKTLLRDKVKRVYTRDADTITINGRSAYFGTDGEDYAAIGFTQGSVMIALELSSKSSGSPAKMKSELVAAAKQLP